MKDNSASATNTMDRHLIIEPAKMLAFPQFLALKICQVLGDSE